MPEYFDRYINLVDNVELSRAFDESIRQLVELDTNLLEKIRFEKSAPDKWTAKEIFQHIIDFERILSYRAMLFARREGSIPQGIDQDRLTANMKAEKRLFADLIAELKAVRALTKAMFESFDDETLLYQGINWKYEMSVLAMGLAIIGHQIHHLNIIDRNFRILKNSI